jgi:hypothetical protein
MSRDQTVFSELAVAYGINNNSLKGIQGLNQDSLEKYERERIRRKNSSNQNLKDSEKYLNKAGEKIKAWLIDSKNINDIKLKWSANSAPGTGDTVAQDLIIVNTNTRISVKENAELFQNPSPAQVFEFWPKGIPFTRARSKDWFIAIASKELDDYFSACDGVKITGQTTVSDYYKKTRGKVTINGEEVKRRKHFTNHVSKLHEQNDSDALNAYQLFCNAVSKESAKVFNKNFENTFTKKKNGFYDINELTNLISVFFKMDNKEHILAGTEENNPFAVIVSDIDSWKQQFSIVDISAKSRQAGQPEVLIEFFFKDNLSGVDHIYSIQSQIRWSHGKFCGNPEGKLYRFGGWKYTELPWCKSL